LRRVASHRLWGGEAERSKLQKPIISLRKLPVYTEEICKNVQNCRGRSPNTNHGNENRWGKRAVQLTVGGIDSFCSVLGHAAVDSVTSSGKKISTKGAGGQNFKSPPFFVRPRGCAVLSILAGKSLERAFPRRISQ